MPWFYCPHCGGTHAPEARFCPATGLLIPAAPPSRWKSAWVWAAGILAALVVVALAVGSLWLVLGSKLPDFLSLQKSQPVVEAPTQTAPPHPENTKKPAAAPTEVPAPTVQPAVQTPVAVEQQAVQVPVSTAVPAQAPTAVPTLPPTTASLSNGQFAGKIVYVCQVDRDSEHDQICLIDPVSAGLQRERVISRNPRAGHKFPSLSPDGRRILYVYTSGDITQIRVMDTGGNDGGELTQAGDFGTINFPTYSPDGHWIAFNGSRDSSDRQAIYLMPSDGSRQPQLIISMNQSVYFNAWSPDSAQILFQAGGSSTNDQTRLYIAQQDGSGIREAPGVALINGRSDWSPDGKSIVVSQGPAGNREIARIDLDSGRVSQLTSGGNNRAPVFSPDGRWLVYVSYRDHLNETYAEWSANGAELYLIPADGGEPVRLNDNRYTDYMPRWGR